jgi:hypothetical protein
MMRLQKEENPTGQGSAPLTAPGARQHPEHRVINAC